MTLFIFFFFYPRECSLDQWWKPKKKKHPGFLFVVKHDNTDKKRKNRKNTFLPPHPRIPFNELKHFLPRFFFLRIMADPLRSPAPAQGLRIRPNQPTRSPPPLRESESEEERKDSKEGERPAFVTGRYRQLQGSSREGGFLGERGGAGRKEEEEEESLGESEDGEEGDELKGRSELNIELGEEGQGRGSVKFLKTVDSAPSLGFFTDSDTSSPRVPNLMSSSPTPQKAVSLAPEELKSTSTSPTSDITPTARRRKSSSVLLRSKTSVNLKKETTKEKEESTSSPSSVPPTPPASIGGGSKKQARSPILRGNKGKQREPLSPKVKMRNPPKKSLRKNRPCSSLGLLQYGRTSAPNLLDGGDMRNLTSSPSSPSSPSLDRGVMRRAGNADKGTQRELSLKMFEEVGNSFVKVNYFR